MKLFPEMIKEEFQSLAESVMTIPLKISSKHGIVLSQLSALRMEDPSNHFGRVLNPDYFMLTKTDKGYGIKLSEAGKRALEENSVRLKKQRLWSSKKQCPILHAGNRAIAEFHPWIVGIFRDYVIPRLWNFYSET